MKKKKLITTLIPIKYEEGNQDKALELKKIIEKNPRLFDEVLREYNIIEVVDSSHIKRKKEGVLYLSSDLDITNTIIALIIKNKFDKIVEKSSVDSLKIYALKCIIAKRSLEEKEITFDKLDINLRININTPIYELAAYLYLKEINRLDKLLEVVLNLTDDVKTELFEWLNTSSRLSLLNQILEEKSAELKREDEFLWQNMGEINFRLINDVASYTEKCQKNEEFPFTTITKEELDSLFSQFLVKIDPSLNLLDVYIDLKTQEKLIISSQDTHISNWKTKGSKNETKIIATLGGNTIDFINFAHEFATYLSKSSCHNYQSIPLTLREFPAIAFETLALGFLYTKGYSQEEIKQLRMLSLSESINKVYFTSTILTSLDEYIVMGPITEKSLVSPKKLPQKIDTINKIIDEKNKAMLFHYYDYLTSYPQIVGNYLTNKVVQRIPSDDTIIPLIISAAYSPTPAMIKEIFEKLNIDDESLTFPLYQTSRSRKYPE